jgi:hypothetical protein
VKGSPTFFVGGAPQRGWDAETLVAAAQRALDELRARVADR